jgi:hypothetical protein
MVDETKNSLRHSLKARCNMAVSVQESKPDMIARDSSERKQSLTNHHTWGFGYTVSWEGQLIRGRRICANRNGAGKDRSRAWGCSCRFEISIGLH